MSTEFKFIKGDITKVADVDAIVNAANCSLQGGGGVDGAIHRAAGPALLEECRTLGGCRTGEAKITRAYNLPCKYVIHTPGPVWQGGTKGEDGLLANCYHNCLELAYKTSLHCGEDVPKIRRISFSSISTGVYSFPLERAADIAITTTQKFCAANPDAFDLIEWVLFDDISLAAYKSAYESASSQAGL